MTHMNHDYLMEKRLHALNPELHQHFTNAVFALQYALSHYRRLFPEYTDHSELHSMAVIDFCNRLIGAAQIEKLNADEIYVLLMSCYLHDAGMGVSEKDYALFKQELDAEAYFAKHPDAAVSSFVRDYHHEFSALFIRKYAQLLEIPSPEHLFCIVQVSRGHRRTNLFDPAEYPQEYPLENGNTVCLPYLASLLRLADEVDVAADRNTLMLYDIESLVDEYQVFCHRLQEAVRTLDVSEDGFTMNVHTDDEAMASAVENTRKKMQETLDLCRTVTHTRTPYRIHQTWVKINEI